MPDMNTITAIVSAAMKAAPLPEDYRDADLQTQRKVEREAEKQGITPAQYWAAVRAQAQHEAAANDEAATIAKAARR